jgi:hypothetical protein
MAGTEFFSRPLDEELANLDLYLLPADSDDLVNATRASISADSNVEHIFWQLPSAGSYKIKVVHNGGLFDFQDYALAWWAGEAIPGDFDNDGDVDGDDLNQWKSNFGTGPGGDADGDGDSDGNDFAIWQQNLGRTSATINSGSVPEPVAFMLFALGAPLVLRRRDSVFCKASLTP